MIEGINHITLGVKDIEKSFLFYKNILGFKPLCKWDKGAYFLAGKDWFCINLDPEQQKSASATHYAFTISEDNFSFLKARIITSGATIYKDNTSPGDSLYFLDPDGHQLEIHTGTWQSRLMTKKENPGSWKNVAWFL